MIHDSMADVLMGKSKEFYKKEQKHSFSIYQVLIQIGGHIQGSNWGKNLRFGVLKMFKNVYRHWRVNALW